MSITKTIVCLANSKRTGGYCVAGREFDDEGECGEWVRPVSERPSEEIYAKEQRYEGGDLPSVLDVIEVPLLRAQPRNHQRENWLLDGAKRWKKSGRLSWARVGELIDPLNDLWSNGSSTKNGMNDRITISDANKTIDSLRFIPVRSLVFSVFNIETPSGHRKCVVRANFSYNGTEYNLGVTDRGYENKYRKMGEGNYEISDCFVTVSLAGKPYNGYFYKLVAAVVESSA